MEQNRAAGRIPVAETALRHPGKAAAETSRSARGEHVHDAREAVPRPRPPQRHSVRGQVLEALRRALLSGELVAGRVYSAPALAMDHGVSATPVREAMQRLASEGLVETVPNRGFRVIEHSVRDVAELAELRVLLEIPPVLRLARTLPVGTWDALRPLAEASVRAASADDSAAYAEADRAFHRALLELTGNRRLTAAVEDALRQAQCAERPRPVPPVPTAGAESAGTPVPRLRGAAGGAVSGSPASMCATPAPPGGAAATGRSTAAPSAWATRSAAALRASAAEHLALLDALRCQDLAAVERILRAHLSAG